MDIYDPFANLVSRGISRAQAPFYITSHWVDLVDFFLGGLSEPLFLTSLSLLHSFIGLLILILPLDYPFPLISLSDINLII